MLDNEEKRVVIYWIAKGLNQKVRKFEVSYKLGQTSALFELGFWLYNKLQHAYLPYLAN